MAADEENDLVMREFTEYEYPRLHPKRCLNSDYFETLSVQERNEQLLASCFRRCHVCVMDAIKAGADVNYAAVDDGLGRTALHIAVLSKNVRLVMYLIERGAQIFFGDLRGGRLPIHYVATTSRDYLTLVNNGIVTKCRRCILRKCYNPAENEASYSEENIHKDTLEILQALLNAGNRIDDKDLKGKEVIHYACSNGNLELLTYLIESGVSVNQLTNINWTPMHCAINAGHETIVRYLVENEANVHIMDHCNHRPLDIVFMTNQPNLFQYFYEYLFSLKHAIDDERDIYLRVQAEIPPLTHDISIHIAKKYPKRELMKFITNEEKRYDHFGRYLNELVQLKDRKIINTSPFAVAAAAAAAAAKSTGPSDVVTVQPIITYLDIIDCCGMSYELKADEMVEFKTYLKQYYLTTPSGDAIVAAATAITDDMICDDDATFNDSIIRELLLNSRAFPIFWKTINKSLKALLKMAAAELKESISDRAYGMMYGVQQSTAIAVDVDDDDDEDIYDDDDDDDDDGKMSTDAN